MHIPCFVNCHMQIKYSTNVFIVFNSGHCAAKPGLWSSEDVSAVCYDLFRLYIVHKIRHKITGKKAHKSITPLKHIWYGIINVYVWQINKESVFGNMVKKYSVKSSVLSVYPLVTLREYKYNYLSDYICKVSEVNEHWGIYCDPYVYYSDPITFIQMG